MRHIRFPLVLLAAVLAVLALSSSPAESAFPGVNGKIAFTSYRDGNDEIYVMNADGSNETNLTKKPGVDDWDPVWSRDGGKIAFTTSRHGNWEVYVMNAADGSDQKNISNYPAGDDQRPAWSPDGTKIALQRWSGDSAEIFVINAEDGSDPDNLTESPGSDGHPAWSPDGSKIAFHSQRHPHPGNTEIYVMDADGTDPKRLTTDPASDSVPVWSPDGSQIAFTTNRGGDYEVYVMNAADGSGQTSVSKSPATSDSSPAWSPDGSQIAFEAWVGNNLDVYVKNADGSGAATRLTDDPANDAFADWQAVESSSGKDIGGGHQKVNLNGVSVECNNVTTPGKATLSTTIGGPPTYRIIVPGPGGKKLYYWLTTTAECTGKWTVCFFFDPNLPQYKKAGIELQKRVDSQWVPIAGTVYVTENKICADLDSLSLFLMVEASAVGGIVDLRADADPPASASEGSSSHTGPLAAAAAAAAALAVTAGAWYARRRWLR